MWAGPAACLLGWLGGTHLLAAAGALLLYAPGLTGLAPRRYRLLASLAAPWLLCAAASVDGLLQVRLIFLLAAVALAWAPFFAELGGGVPYALWTLPIVLGVATVALVGPWGLSLVASDIAARAQVVILASVALVVHAVAREV